VAHGAPQDAAQDVSPPLVGGQHAIGDQEARSPQVIGDHAMRGLVRTLGVDPRRRHRGRDQRTEEIDLVIVVGALQHRGDALEPHARVDRGLRQRDAFPARLLLILHEDEIPDLDEAIAVGIGGTWRSALDLRAMVEEDLRARPARPGVAHRPEVVGGRNADDLVVAEPRHVPPDAVGFLVVVVDGDQKSLRVEAELLGNELPGERDRELLEVVAEREVTEHLEEGVVACRIADIVEVVVLAANAQALLRGGRAHVGARLLAREDVLELHHAGRGEQQRRVVARHERGGGHDLMAIAAEELKKCAADLVDGRHRGIVELGVAAGAGASTRAGPRAARPCKQELARQPF
jgi:hypothetical protein